MVQWVSGKEDAMKNKTMEEIRDAEADVYSLAQIPKGDYEFEGTFRGYVENYPSDDRRHIAADFKAGFDCRDKLDNEREIQLESALKIAIKVLRDICSYEDYEDSTFKIARCALREILDLGVEK